MGGVKTCMRMNELTWRRRVSLSQNNMHNNYSIWKLNKKRTSKGFNKCKCIVVMDMQCHTAVFIHHLSKKIHVVYGGSFGTSDNLIGRVAFFPRILFPNRTDNVAFELSSWHELLSFSPQDSSTPVSMPSASSCLFVNKSASDTVLSIAVFLLHIDKP